ncbi:MAG: GPR endopeptidase [Clostridia bacterium]|nr:GPR endopeptidase [Clostridia bacterium]
MKNIATDLAVESKEFISKKSDIDGVLSEEFSDNGFNITKIDILTENAARMLSKDIGRYITIDLKNVLNIPDIKTITEVIKRQLETLFPHKSFKNILVVGLGNRDMTPDSLGPLTTDFTLVTRHLKDALPDYFKNEILNTVSAIIPGVLGKTGIESQESIKSAVENINPDLVIVIDALASRGIKRLTNTIQMSNTGLCPGGGVGNKRREISKNTLGTEVLSIGVPTVCDLATLCYDILSIINDENIHSHHEKIENALIKDNNFLISINEIDEVIIKLSKILGYSINRFLHKGLSFEEMESFLS